MIWSHLCETGGENEGGGFFVEILKTIAREEHGIFNLWEATLDRAAWKCLLRGKIDLLVAADYSEGESAGF
jgi:hypothetical protein